jgi:hypothetical protein
MDLWEMFGKATSKLGYIFGPSGLYIRFIWQGLGPFVTAVSIVLKLLNRFPFADDFSIYLDYPNNHQIDIR